MKIAISQPMYLPWGGLFNQIGYCDIFVHYDDVQLPQGRYFTNRIQIKTERGQKWLTVPLVHSSRGLIKDVLMDEEKGWRKEHLNLFSLHLNKAPFYSDAQELLNKIYALETDRLSLFNIHAIELISSYLGFRPIFFKSSDLFVEASSSKKLLEIMKKLKGTLYITGHGAKEYLDHNIFEKSGIDVHYMEYNLIPYPQLYGEFTPYVSVIDMIAYQGKSCQKLMQSKLLNWRNFLGE